MRISFLLNMRIAIGKDLVFLQITKKPRLGDNKHGLSFEVRDRKNLLAINTTEGHRI